MERHDAKTAAGIVEQLLPLLQQAAESENPHAKRNLSIALNFKGDVEQALGRLEEARTAYRESEALSERLVQACPSCVQNGLDLDRIRRRLQALEDSD